MTEHKLADELARVCGAFCYLNCPHGTEQNWPHDPACETMRQAVAALRRPSFAEGVEADVRTCPACNGAGCDGMGNDNCYLCDGQGGVVPFYHTHPTPAPAEDKPIYNPELEAMEPDDYAFASARQNPVAASAEDALRAAAKRVLDGLNARIDAAPKDAVPVFDGISDLRIALFEGSGT